MHYNRKETECLTAEKRLLLNLMLKTVAIDTANGIEFHNIGTATKGESKCITSRRHKIQS